MCLQISKTTIPEYPSPAVTNLRLTRQLNVLKYILLTNLLPTKNNFHKSLNSLPHCIEVMFIVSKTRLMIFFWHLSEQIL